MASKKFFTYKNKPLVRKGNVIYYGHMYEDVVAMLTIQTTKEQNGLKVADSVQVQLISTDPTTPPQEMVLKHSVRTGLFDALDMAGIWIDRTLK